MIYKMVTTNDDEILDNLGYKPSFKVNVNSYYQWIRLVRWLLVGI
jgi:hypothetical protein